MHISIYHVYMTDMYMDNCVFMCMNIVCMFSYVSVFVNICM